MSRHQYRTVVKRVHPHAQRWRLLALLSTLSVCVAAGVWWGMQLALVSPPAEDQQAALKDQIAQLLLQSEADKQTVNELRNDLADQAAEFAALEDMLAFYRGVLAPESDALAVLRPRFCSRLPMIGCGRCAFCIEGPRVRRYIRANWRSRLPVKVEAHPKSGSSIRLTANPHLVYSLYDSGIYSKFRW